MTSRRCCRYMLVVMLTMSVIAIYLARIQSVSIINYNRPPSKIPDPPISNRTKPINNGDLGFVLQKGSMKKQNGEHMVIPHRNWLNSSSRASPSLNFKQDTGWFHYNASLNSIQQISKGQNADRVNFTTNIKGDNHHSPLEINVNITEDKGGTEYSNRQKNFGTETDRHNTNPLREGFDTSSEEVRVDSDILTIQKNVSNVQDEGAHETYHKSLIRNLTAKESKSVKPIQFNYFGVHELNVNISNNAFEPFCAEESNRQRYLLWPDTPTDFTDWSFTRRRKCPKFVINDKITNIPRIKYSLNCDSGKAQLVPSETTSSSDVDVINLNNTCLYKFINACCSNDEGVPNVVHYVWYFKKAMKFETFLSILSVVRFVRPCLILFHGAYVPYGVYWDYIIRLFPNIIHVNTPRPRNIFGKKIHHHEHSGDVMRIHALMRYGGIYLDTDVIVLRDLKPLRYYDITLCRQTGGQFLLNSFIMTKKNATFLTLWLEGYKKDFRNESYVYNSMYYNNDLSRKYPNLIHVENGTMCCPDELIGVNLQSRMIYEWTNLYGFHIYSRQINFPWNVDLIRNFSTTLGSMLRHVVYGNKELCL